MSRVTRLEEMARDLVGDGKKPEVFFVSAKGTIKMITADFSAAYTYWQDLSEDETALENRTVGTLASKDTATGIIDDSHYFGFQKGK